MLLFKPITVKTFLEGAGGKYKSRARRVSGAALSVESEAVYGRRRAGREGWPCGLTFSAVFR